MGGKRLKMDVDCGAGDYCAGGGSVLNTVMNRQVACIAGNALTE
jgi:hypothetical protein